MHTYPTRALAVLAALGLLCLSAPALAHHRPGPCDLHRGADETVRSHSRRLVRCAAERWEVPGGVETALCIAQAESGLNPETASEGGDFLGLYQHSAEAWLRGVDTRRLEAGRERAVRADERDRDDPDGERERLGALGGRRGLLRRGGPPVPARR